MPLIPSIKLARNDQCHPEFIFRIFLPQLQRWNCVIAPGGVERLGRELHSPTLALPSGMGQLQRWLLFFGREPDPC